jgi:hypothetical protein
MIQLQPNPDGPISSVQRGLLTKQLALFHGVTRLVVVAAVSMNSSSVEGKEPHADPDRRALVDPLQKSVFDKARRSKPS